ncbi:MAG: orotidine-5'-phosphate decarboxylase [Planctomycetota bacterium]|nr:orotidine-5'-phosphate decarboxylase [Planctomycetota bacterium]
MTTSTRTAPFFDRLEEARRTKKSVLCVGIDPRPERIPEAFHEAAGGDIERLLTDFGTQVLAQAGPYAACFKPQIAFFEQHGLAGLKAFATLVGEARSRNLLVIGDIKRGDIGSTAEAYAHAFLEPGGDFEVDAVTLNPYLGADSLGPFVERAAANGKGLYVLVRTSNAGAKDLQELTVADSTDRVFERTADMVTALGAPHVSETTGLSAVGAVVGATSPEAGARARERMPHTPLLVPGYGAQGGTAADAAVCFRPDGSGAVVNASRSINHPPAPDGDWHAAVARAAQAAQEELYAACCPD